MITIENLEKQFNNRKVLKELNLQIPAGQATGITGPNGSGKTTLIKIILGLVKADAGVVTVNNSRLDGSCDYRQEIGYMPQIARYPENMKVKELFHFIEGLRRKKPVCKEELINRFNLIPELEKPLRILSGGTRQKVGATLAMMFDPRLLIFDEPTAGLDPQASFKFKEWVSMEKSRGKTIIITSHIMSEMEQLADHVVFLLEGRVQYSGALKNLVQNEKGDRLELIISRMMEEAAA